MSERTPSSGIDSLLRETRVFPPPAEVAANACVGSMEAYRALYAEAERDLPGFWAKQAAALEWSHPPSQILDESDAPFYRWFTDGKLNLTVSCLDRHLATRGDKPAFVWVGEPDGERRVYTYRQLHEQVAKAAGALRALGIEAGDRVALYMPLVPELAVAMLACARLGATHSVIFGGFAAEAIRDRVRDAGARIVITADGGFRRGKVVALKDMVDRALADGACPTVTAVVVVRRTHCPTNRTPLDVEWADVVSAAEPVAAVPVDAEHPLFILYTSGTTGKPKGVVHSTGGYGVQIAYTTKLVFDLREDDIYWCTADIGWVTGHSYVVYGALLNGATVVLYEGAPDQPDKDRFWKICADEKVTILYTAPTAIRTFMRWGEELPRRHDLSSLRLLGSVGEPINPEAWMWYHRVIGGERCPIVDTWWQTETGAIMVSPLPGATPTKPGSCTLPLPGVILDVVDRDGRPVGKGRGGLLVLKRPWPSMLRTLWNDPERYLKSYFSEITDPETGTPFYFAGDGARLDEDGYLWVMGRVDDVLNVSGHRLGTMEIESALVAHPHVAEAAVVGRPDEQKGQAVVAFVTLKSGREPGPHVVAMLREHVTREIGALARPEEIRFTDTLPKTRSGKIMRRLLKEIAAGQTVSGDTTTLEDASVLASLSAKDDE
ncbi:MAG: acetate--CoA ligase [Polyangia bacterium]